MTIKAEQIIRNINISILTDIEMESPYKEIYGYFMDFLSNLSIKKRYATKNVAVLEHFVYVDENNKAIMILLSNRDGSIELYIKPDIYRVIRIYLVKKCSVYINSLNYLFRYFLKYNFPSELIHDTKNIRKTLLPIYNYINITGIKI